MPTGTNAALQPQSNPPVELYAHEQKETPLSLVNSVLVALSKLSSFRASSSSKAAGRLPDAARTLLLTLHVVFPHCLLEALDLLDRGLVTRLVLADQLTEQAAPAEDAYGSAAEAVREIAGGDDLGTNAPEPRANARETGRRVVGYAVRSTAGATPSTFSSTNTTAPNSYARDAYRRNFSNILAADADESPLSSGTAYHVHLTAWNCSCPAFAFAAYDSGTSRGAAISPMTMGPQTTRLHPGRQRAWSTELGPSPRFGGVSLAGSHDSDAMARRKLPPVCKHLLAFLLGEACPSLFGNVEEGGVSTRGVREKSISLNEAAGWAGGANLRL